MGLKTISVVKSIRRIKVKLQETIKHNISNLLFISNKSKNILGVDRVEQFMQRRNVEVYLSYHIIVVTLEEHMSYC